MKSRARYPSKSVLEHLRDYSGIFNVQVKNERYYSIHIIDNSINSTWYTTRENTSEKIVLIASSINSTDGGGIVNRTNYCW